MTIKTVTYYYISSLVRNCDTYPSNLSSPRHHDGIGDGGGQSDQWGNVDGPAGPLGLYTVFGWRKITLYIDKEKEIISFFFCFEYYKVKL